MKLEQYIQRLDWTRSKEDPEVFYRMSEQGLWFPDSIHKPFLRAAVAELQDMERHYQRLRSYFDGKDEV